MVGIGLSLDAHTGAALMGLIVAGSVPAWGVSLLWPERPPQPTHAASATPTSVLSYGIRLGAAGATAAAIGFALGFDHVGWACAAALLVMRPSAEMQRLRSVGRVVAVTAGAAAAAGIAAVTSAPGWYCVVALVPLRHRFIDEHLAAALDDGAAQVVLLGAGYDTRAYRFADQLAGRPVFEVDLAAISRAKAATIAKHSDEFPETNVVRVEIDFETQALADVLADAGCEVGGLTFFVWEGVPMYLTRAAVKSTLDAVHALERRWFTDRPRHVVPGRRTRTPRRRPPCRPGCTQPDR